MPRELSYQVDTPHDLFIIEQLVKSKENSCDDFFSVQSKNIVLTGSSGLLGSHYARLLLKKGANIALIDINPHVSESILEEFSYTGQNIKFYKCDLSKSQEIISIFKKIRKDFSSIDVLINNAAFTSRQTFHIKDFKDYEKHPFNLWKRMFEVNIDAVHLCTQQVIGVMKKQRYGVIINISSTYGVVGPDFDTYENEKLWTPPGYAVTKSAVLNYTRYIANLYGKYNIRCNTLTPSGVETKALSRSFIKKYSSRNAFKRMAKLSDYSGPILFLCSDASRYMTGANLIVDGGWTAK
jgi:NAD(P)-dependent dehydrogenase (short-subunit alcohol dehydrogenase family)